MNKHLGSFTNRKKGASYVYYGLYNHDHIQHKLKYLDFIEHCLRPIDHPISFFYYLAYEENYGYSYFMILERYVKFKKILYPDDVKKFNDLFTRKHKFNVNTLERWQGNSISYLYKCFLKYGCYYRNDKLYKSLRIHPLYGTSGILSGKPISPSPDKEIKHFLKASSLKIKDIYAKRNKNVR